MPMFFYKRNRNEAVLTKEIPQWTGVSEAIMRKGHSLALSPTSSCDMTSILTTKQMYSISMQNYLFFPDSSFHLEVLNTKITLDLSKTKLTISLYKTSPLSSISHCDNPSISGQELIFTIYIKNALENTDFCPGPTLPKPDLQKLGVGEGKMFSKLLR